MDNRIAELIRAAFVAGYHAQWIRDQQRWIFGPAMKPGDPQGAFHAWLIDAPAVHIDDYLALSDLPPSG
jgi:hypothetical protein